MKEYTAGEITKEAIKVLTNYGFNVWRQNNISIKGRTFRGKYGVSDVTGYAEISGKRVECEVKTLGDNLSKKQIDFLNEIEKNNAHAYVAYQDPDYETGVIFVDDWGSYKKQFPEKVK